jgi:hypothetical protein
MSIAGCVSRLDKWDSFRIEWRSALGREGLEHFHMTDFEAWVPPFDFKLNDGSRDRHRHNRLLNSLLNIILEYVESFCGFTAGNQISTDTRRAHRLALEDCTLSAVGHAVNDLWWQYKEPINLVFGKQKHFGYASMMECVELYNWGDGCGRIQSADVANPNDVPPLEAADILAYEMGKVQRDGRPRRYPFVMLLEGCKARNIPMTLKWASIVRISDRAAFERGDR